MTLYALDDGELTYAEDALPGKTYHCVDCFKALKYRKGKVLAHFYHVNASINCRLYSKTERHLLAQLQLQKIFPEGALQMERFFPKISRRADLCWEEAKIIFEIQCSPISEKEVAQRILDYRSLGYEVIWLLDDRRYNRSPPHPAEEFLLPLGQVYYISIRSGLYSEYYRKLQGKRLRVDLQNIQNLPKMPLPIQKNSFLIFQRIFSWLNKTTLRILAKRL